MDLGLSGKVALVTGGSHGIGLSIANALAAEGCSIAICGRTSERLDAAKRQLSAHEVPVLTIKADCMLDSVPEAVVKETVTDYSTLDILVNNVGGGGSWGSPIIEEVEDDIWREVLSNNALTAARFTRLAIPHMRAKKWGRVVTISSMYGKEGGGRPWFNMAKAAQIAMMKTMAMQPYLARDGITFNSVAPGAIMIPETRWGNQEKRDPSKFKEMVDSTFPLGRLGLPEEVADVVTFLCSTKSSLVNGATIAVDGGESKSY